MRRVGKRGGAFWKRKNRAFRRWLVTEKPCLLAGKYTMAQLCPDDQPEPWLELGRVNYNKLRWRHVCWHPLDPAHVGEPQARGASDVGACVVLCRPAHRLYDTNRPRFHRVTGISERVMEREAGGYGLAWVERGGNVTEAA